MEAGFDLIRPPIRQIAIEVLMTLGKQAPIPKTKNPNALKSILRIASILMFLGTLSPAMGKKIMPAKIVKGLANESLEARKRNRREYDRKRNAEETHEARRIRMKRQNERSAGVRAAETPEGRKLRLDKKREYYRTRKAEESAEGRKIRLDKQREYDVKSRAKESPEDRLLRLERMRERYTKNF